MMYVKSVCDKWILDHFYIQIGTKKKSVLNEFRVSHLKMLYHHRLVVVWPLLPG